LRPFLQKTRHLECLGHNQKRRRIMTIQVSLPRLSEHLPEMTQMIHPQMTTSRVIIMRVMQDVAQAVTTTPPNRLVAIHVSIVNIELAVGGEIINREKYAIRTNLAGVLADKDDGTDRDKYDSHNRFDSLYNLCCHYNRTAKAQPFPTLDTLSSLCCIPDTILLP
jgi:hypothetical protein